MKFQGMTRRIQVFLLVLVFTATLLPHQALAAEPTDESQGVFVLAEDLSLEAADSGADYDGYIFKLKDGADIAPASRRSAFLQENDEISPIEYMPGYYTVDSLDALREAVDESDIEFIEPDYIIRLYGEPGGGVTENSNDEHLNLMHVPAAWDNGLTGADIDSGYDMGGDGESSDRIVVAVIDSGLAEGHEDIDYSQVLPGKNFISGTDNTADTLGHGTFIAGEIIAAENGAGIIGIAQDAYIMPLKVFASKETEVSTVISAITYASEQKEAFDDTNGVSGENICVINLSLGSETPSVSLEDAVNKAIAAGIIVIASAGNDGDIIEAYPAQYAIGVGSTDAAGECSYYSQILSKGNGKGYENKVWVTAPGEDYTSTWYDGGYYIDSGTSFSAPQVSALAAISVGIKNDLTEIAGDSTNHGAFRALLRETAQYIDSGADIAGQDIFYGWGIVDFAEMTEKLLSFSENVGNDSAVSFSVKSEAGVPLTAGTNNLNITVKQNGSDAAESAQNGVYTLKIGTKYNYTITADKFKAAIGQFIPVTDYLVIPVFMEGKDYNLSFSVTNTAGQKILNPVISVTKSGGAALSRLSDGSFNVKNGSYNYTVSAQNYFPTSGEFTIDDSEQIYEGDKYAIEVMLTGAQDVCSVEFAVTGSDGAPYAEVVVRDEGGKTVSAYFGGAWKLDPGNYIYTITSDYYNSVSGSLTVNEADKGTSRTIRAVMDQRLYWVFFDVMPLSVMTLDTTDMTVKDDQGKIAEPFGGDPGQYHLTNGVYSYSIKADGYKTSKGTFTVAGSVLYVAVQLEKGSDTPEVVPDDGDDTGGGSGGGGGGGGGGSILDDDSQTTNVQTVPDNFHKRFAIQSKYHSFADVGRDSWYYEPVNYVVTLGLYNGLSDVQFSPDAPMTRAMMAAVLFRLSGEDRPQVRHSFEDVAEGAYYLDAVSWGAEHKILQGTSERAFGPDSGITREQLITILYRYSLYAELVSEREDDNAAKDLRDFSAVSEYAKEAAGWAYKNGIINGDSQNLLRPSENATRAEVAAMVTRFINNIILKQPQV